MHFHVFLSAESETLVALRCLSYFLIPKRKAVKETNPHVVVPNLLMGGTVGLEYNNAIIKLTNTHSHF